MTVSEGFKDRLFTLHREVDETLHFFISSIKRADFWWDEDEVKKGLGMEEECDLDQLFHLPTIAHIDKYSNYDSLNIIRVFINTEGDVVFTAKSTGETNINTMDFTADRVELASKIEILDLILDGKFAQAMKS